MHLLRIIRAGFLDIRMVFTLPRPPRFSVEGSAPASRGFFIQLGGFWGLGTQLWVAAYSSKRNQHVFYYDPLAALAVHCHSRSTSRWDSHAILTAANAAGDGAILVGAI